MTDFLELTPEQQQKLVQAALRQIAKQQPLNPQMVQALSPEALKMLLALVEQLKAQGLVGPHTRTPERLLAMFSLINQWGGRPETEPTGDEIVAQMIPQARDRLLAMEAIQARQSNAQAMVDSQESLAALRNPGIL